MRHTGAALRITDGEVDVIVCHPDIYDILLASTHDLHGPVIKDGWYSFAAIQGASSSAGLVPIDSLPEI